MSDSQTKCPVRRNHEKIDADALARGIDPELLKKQDIGPCNWTGMTEKEIAKEMRDLDLGACANPRHRNLLERVAGDMPDPKA